MNKRKRKKLVVLPLFVIPFLTLGFWALGGGRMKEEQKNNDGLNTRLPQAHFKKEDQRSKLNFYEEEKKKEEFSLPTFHLNDTLPKEYGQEAQNASEEKLVQQLAQLKKEIKEPVPAYPSMLSQKNSSLDSREVDRLEKMMQRMRVPVEDPALEQINNVMDKILQVQKKETKKEEINSSTNKKEGLTVRHKNNTASISLVGESDSLPNSFFNGFNDVSGKKENTIAALVDGTQSLVTGSIIKLQLTHAVSIEGIEVPAQQLIFGTVTLQGERLHIDISSLRWGNQILPVALEAYDLDGLPGIYIPGAITRDVAKEAADGSIHSIELGSLDPSIKAQATTAGISALKKLWSKKAKLVKVEVKTGYHIFLKNNSSF
jgi:conjugative transposon TraM protein